MTSTRFLSPSLPSPTVSNEPNPNDDACSSSGLPFPFL